MLFFAAIQPFNPPRTNQSSAKLRVQTRITPDYEEPIPPVPTSLYSYGYGKSTESLDEPAPPPPPRSSVPSYRIPMSVSLTSTVTPPITPRNASPAASPKKVITPTRSEPDRSISSTPQRSLNTSLSPVRRSSPPRAHSPLAVPLTSSTPREAPSPRGSSSGSEKKTHSPTVTPLMNGYKEGPTNNHVWQPPVRKELPKPNVWSPGSATQSNPTPRGYRSVRPPEPVVKKVEPPRKTPEPVRTPDPIRDTPKRLPDPIFQDEVIVPKSEVRTESAPIPPPTLVSDLHQEPPAARERTASQDSDGKCLCYFAFKTLWCQLCNVIVFWPFNGSVWSIFWRYRSKADTSGAKSLVRLVRWPP